MALVTVTTNDAFLTALNNWLHECMCSKYRVPFSHFDESEKGEHIADFTVAAIDTVKVMSEVEGYVPVLRINDKYRSLMYRELPLKQEYFTIIIKNPFNGKETIHYLE